MTESTLHLLELPLCKSKREAMASSNDINLIRSAMQNMALSGSSGSFACHLALQV